MNETLIEVITLVLYRSVDDLSSDVVNELIEGTEVSLLRLGGMRFS